MNDRAEADANERAPRGTLLQCARLPPIACRRRRPPFPSPPLPPTATPLPTPSMPLSRLPLLLLLLALTGCDLFGESDDDRPLTTGVIVTDSSLTTGVFVADQGNFSDGNGSITTYDPETGASTARAVADLESIVQGIAVADGVLYVAANTGDAVLRYDAQTLQPLGAIAADTPRYVAVDSERDRAYVTTGFAGELRVVELGSGATLDTVAIPAVPEGVTLAGGVVYVGQGFGAADVVTGYRPSDGSTFTLDPDCNGPRSVHEDGEGELWVVCTGETLFDESFNVVGEEPGGVRVLRPDGQIVARFDTDARPGSAASGHESFYSPEAGALLVIAGDEVLRFDTRANAPEGPVALPPSDDPIGAVALDGTRGALYVARLPADAPFSAAGYVTVHDAVGGLETDRFGAGVAPSQIAFAGGER